MNDNNNRNECVNIMNNQESKLIAAFIGGMAALSGGFVVILSTVSAA